MALVAGFYVQLTISDDGLPEHQALCDPSSTSDFTENIPLLLIPDDPK